MKRFYRDVAVGDRDLSILLDGKPVRTPAGHVLTLPTRALADAIAAEWREQSADIVPASMPLLRFANTVIDGVTADRAGVTAAILRFGEHDLLRYRAEVPQLAARQKAAWEPLLDWADAALGARLAVTTSVTTIAQSPAALAALEQAITVRDDFELAALHVMASITGSLVLALATTDRITPAEAFALSRLEETFQAERWGLDHDAEQRAQGLGREMENAARLIALSRR